MSEGSASSTASSSSDDTDHEFPLMGTASDFMRTYVGSITTEEALHALTWTEFRIISLHRHPNSETQWIAIDRETGEWWDLPLIISDRITALLEATADDPGAVALEQAFEATGDEAQRPYMEMLRAEAELNRDMARERAEREAAQGQPSQWANQEQPT